MIISQDPEIVREILDRLVDEYVEEKPYPHVTQLIYCLTRSYFDITQGTQPTDDELMLFAVGWGLERVLLESHAEPGEKDGISYSPDFVTLRGAKAELKTTRMSSKKTAGPEYELPEGWVKQIMAYCYANGSLRYQLVVLHLMGNYAPPFPRLAGLTLEFNEDELSENWSWILSRRLILDQALYEKVIPVPFTYNMSWECKYCRHKIVCDALEIAARRKDG